MHDMTVKPHLILNFDVNGTLILNDSTKKESKEYMLICALAKNTFSHWRKEVEGDEKLDAVSFKDYVDRELIPGDKSCFELKKERQRLIAGFFEWLSSNSHPVKDQVLADYRRIKDKFTVPGTEEVKYTVFRSFYRMLETLRKMNIPFTLVLRSFGQDLSDVVREINEHPLGLRITQRAKFEGIKLTIDEGSSIEKVEDIFEKFLISESHFAIQDDWEKWNADGERGRSGKPFFYDASGMTRVKNLSLFFDDNITGEKLDIVQPHEINGNNASTHTLREKLIFRVNTRDAALNDNYYIDHVLNAIRCSEEAAINAKAQSLARKIMEKTQALITILSDYQTHDVTCYEIERSIRTLNELHENNMYLGLDKKIDGAAVMLPSNLPLYSLVIFALIPSFLCNQVYVRPNSLLQEKNILPRIYEELELHTQFSNVNLINSDHAGFKQYIKNTSLIVFTGKPSNADNLIQEMKEGAVLIVNGSGHNPVVVTSSADIKMAVAGTLLLKGFNGGQDCAGPDAILVQQDVAKEFIDEFSKQFSSLKTGGFEDPETVIGPINRLSELLKFANIFHNNKGNIISGGAIDFKTCIVSPTTIVREITDPNYKEMFGPVAFIHQYKKDQDLSYYFNNTNGQYNANRMYVTLYGQSDYVSSRDDTLNPNNPGNIGIVLHNQTIHDVEIGYKPYGGYSLGASGVIKKTSEGVQKVAMPILINQVIFNYLINDENLPSVNLAIKREKQIEPTVKNFQDIAINIFQDNLVFGFIFNSKAKGESKINNFDKNEPKTFICLKENNSAAEQEYLRHLNDLQHAVIVTLRDLENTLSSLERKVIVPAADTLITSNQFDPMLWIDGLRERKKVGFIGDGKTMSRLIKIATSL